MLEIKDIEKLAKLARIELTEEEKEKFLRDIDPILGYIAQIKEVSKTIERKVSEHRNVTRDDIIINETGKNTKDISSNFPEKERDYLKVKKIL